ncbi:hypothetical protein NLN88_24000, partial [Citrobacter portucalensis]|nr:hypothetical protein [Citrobacter portucalensis]
RIPYRLDCHKLICGSFFLCHGKQHILHNHNRSTPGSDYHQTGGEYVDGHTSPEFPGAAWGTVVFMKASLAHLTEGYKANYQNL